MNMRGLSDLNHNSGGGGGSDSSGNSCSDFIKSVWDNTPLWTRFLFFISVGIYGFSWVTEMILYYLFCSPQLIIYKFEIWRLFSGHFVHPQILTLLFALLSHLPHAANAERTIGTVRYFFRFWLLGTVTLLLFTIVCGVGSLNQFSLGLWPMFFCDLAIECMQNAEQTQGLCCLPIQIKRKWYPLIVIAIFSIMFFQLSMWFGLAVGYAYHYGAFARIEMGANRATILEGKFPFRRAQDKPYFITAGSSMGGSILPSFMNGRSSAQESNASNNATSTAASSSSAAGFKAFAGKGQSIGGTPVEVGPRYSSNGASATRARSTPETRLAAAAASLPVGEPVRAPGARTGSALIAKLEEKKRQETAADSSALTTTDVGHDMEPVDASSRAGDDKNSAAYAKVNLNDSENSV